MTLSTPVFLIISLAIVKGAFLMHESVILIQHNCTGFISNIFQEHLTGKERS